jgi:hypothetical protein
LREGVAALPFFFLILLGGAGFFPSSARPPFPPPPSSAAAILSTAFLRKRSGFEDIIKAAREDTNHPLEKIKK